MAVSIAHITNTTTNTGMTTVEVSDDFPVGNVWAVGDLIIVVACSADASGNTCTISPTAGNSTEEATSVTPFSGTSSNVDYLNSGGSLYVWVWSQRIDSIDASGIAVSTGYGGASGVKRSFLLRARPNSGDTIPARASRIAASGEGTGTTTGAQVFEINMSGVADTARDVVAIMGTRTTALASTPTADWDGDGVTGIPGTADADSASWAHPSTTAAVGCAAFDETASGTIWPGDPMKINYVSNPSTAYTAVGVVYYTEAAVQNLAANLLDAAPTIHTPALQYDQNIAANLLTATPTIHTPSLLSDGTIVASLLTATPTVFTPGLQYDQSIVAPLLNATPTIHTPEIVGAEYDEWSLPDIPITPGVVTPDDYVSVVARARKADVAEAGDIKITFVSAGLDVDVSAWFPLTDSFADYTLTPLGTPSDHNDIAVRLTFRRLTTDSLTPEVSSVELNVLYPDQNLVAPLLNAAPTVHTPVSITLGQPLVTVGLLDASPTIFTPRLQYDQNLVAPLSNFAPTIHQPSIAGTQNIAALLLNAAPTVFTPSIHNVVLDDVMLFTPPTQNNIPSILPEYHPGNRLMRHFAARPSGRNIWQLRDGTFTFRQPFPTETVEYGDAAAGPNNTHEGTYLQVFYGGAYYLITDTDTMVGLVAFLTDNGYDPEDWLTAVPDDSEYSDLYEDVY